MAQAITFRAFGAEDPEFKKAIRDTDKDPLHHLLSTPK
jgi:hypothetical protein